ncbi:MAG: translation initiation factor IF-3 [Chloroflexota bacterium]
MGHASRSDGGSFVEGAALIAKDLRINDMIRIREVRVIDDEGQQLGVLPTTEALALAQEKGLDLVEVAPAAVPPVCRILDYGQYKYELQKREREAKRKQKSQTFKEIRLRVKIDVHDLRTKTRRAGEFLEDGDRVKVTVQFRGREMSHANLGRDLLDRAAEMLTEHGVVERPPLLEGRNMFIVMAPHEKRVEKKSDRAEPTDGVIPAATNGETIGEALAAKGMAPTATVEPEPTEQIHDAKDEDPQGNGQAL